MARVSTPVSATMPRRCSQAEKLSAARQLCGSVMGARKTAPSAARSASGDTVSTSSSLAPTLPIWGNVNVTTWPA